MGGRWRRNGEAFERYERVTRRPLTVAGILLVPVVLVPVIVDPPTVVGDVIGALSTAFWVVFAADYATRLYLSPDPGHYFWTHLFDLALVLLWMFPIFTIPRGTVLLRSLAGARLVPLVLSSARHAWDLWRSARPPGRGRTLIT